MLNRIVKAMRPGSTMSQEEIDGLYTEAMYEYSRTERLVDQLKRNFESGRIDSIHAKKTYDRLITKLREINSELETLGKAKDYY